MWMVTVICSGPDCGEQDEFAVATLEEAEALVCECGCCFATVAIASFEPVYSGVG